MAAKILLVEDDNNLREIYEARLQAEGYTIVTAKDGEEALVVAKAEKPSLVISDVMMPRISGFEMLDILRNTEDLRDTKVIMLTALGQADDKTRANSLGADRYLVKSQVTLEDIVKAAHELTEGGMPAPAAPVATPQVTPAAAPSNGAAPSFSPPVPPAAPVTPPDDNPAAAGPVFASMMGAQPSAAPAMPQPSPVMPAAPTPSMDNAYPAASVESIPVPADEQPAASAPGDTATKQDDAVLASAMTELAANTDTEEKPETVPASAPADTAPMMPPAPLTPPVAAPVPENGNSTTNGSVPIANKKVIQPLSGESKPSIHELLAKEEAKGILNSPQSGQTTDPAVTAPSAPAMPADAADTPPTPAPQAGNVFGPTAAPSQPPAVPSTPPAPSNGPDPNSIAL